MPAVLNIKIDPSIVLPDSCDDMPEDLRGHLLATLTIACERYGWKYENLRWAVKIDKKSKLPYITVKPRECSRRKTKKT